MKIVQYINELIQENGLITIPDFGSFILKDTSTRIDESKKVISPPSKVLTFDESIKENDSILSDYLAKTEGLTKENADDAIKKFVAQLSSLLNSGKTVEFRNIGKLHLNNKKQIVFDYDAKAEYVSESYGLTAVKAKTFAKPKEVKQVVIKEKEPKVKKTVKKFPKAAIWLIIVFIPVAAVIVLAFLYPDKTKEIYTDSKDYVTGLFTKSEPDNNVKPITVVSDTLKNNTKPNNTDTISNRPPENRVNSNSHNNSNNNSTKPEVNTVVDETKRFHIIVGCFQSKTNAQKYFKTIESKGYTPRFFEAGSDGLYKISCGSYSTRGEANQQLSKVTNDIGAQAWILKK